jgi:hypothetical protein
MKAKLNGRQAALEGWPASQFGRIAELDVPQGMPERRGPWMARVTHFPCIFKGGSTSAGYVGARRKAPHPNLTDVYLALHEAKGIELFLI